MFEHSVKVPRLYKIATKIAKDFQDNKGSLKQLVYEAKHSNIKALYALVAETLKKKNEIDSLLKRSKLFIKEPRFDPILARILVTELLWGKKRLAGESKPVKTILAYEQIFKAHLSNVKISSFEDNSQENESFIPAHTKQATNAIFILLFFSFLMFTMPFVAFYGTRHCVEKYLTGYAANVWGVIAAVVTVNLIIAVYAYIGYHEQEYEEDGRPIIKEDAKKD